MQEGLASITAAKLQANTDALWYHPDMPGLAKALIARGADVNARIGKGVPPWDFPPYAHGGGIALPQIRHVGATPFLLAAAGGDAEMMRLLLAAGANPKATTDEGTTALMAAAGVGQLRERAAAKRKGAYEATLLAIELGNEVRAIGAGNRTALHGAAHKNFLKGIEYLVSKGGDLSIRSHRETQYERKGGPGNTALDWATGIQIGMQSAIYHEEAVDLISRLMIEHGLDAVGLSRTKGGNAKKK